MRKKTDGRRQVLSAFLPVLAAVAIVSGCANNRAADATAVSGEQQTEQAGAEQEKDTEKQQGAKHRKQQTKQLRGKQKRTGNPAQIKPELKKRKKKSGQMR